MTLADITFRPPRIETERLILRGYEPSDAPAIFEYSSDPDTTRFMAWERAQSIDDAYDFLNNFVASNYEKSQLDYAIALRGNEQHCIGGLGLYWHPKAHQVMELGYILRRDRWGEGFVPEAARALIDHAFLHTPVERIYAPIFASNQKSRRTAEKIGMQLDGVLRSSLNHRGQRWDEAIYSILRRDHAARQ